MHSIKTLLKRLRSVPLLNRVATSVLERTIGERSELLIRHLHRLGSVRSRLPNGETLQMWSQADDWVCNQVFWRGWDGYEPEATRLFFRWAQRSQTTLDIGAYVGFYTLLAAKANRDALVFAFEPMAEIFARLENHVRINGLENVTCIQAAVSEEEGEATFFHVDEALPTSSSLSSDFMEAADGVIGTRVDVRSIDTFLDRRGVDRIDLLKIDTETTEPAVLRGMTRRLTEHRPAIFCEVLAGHETGPALEELLAPHDYNYYLLTDEGPERMSRIEGHPHWLNYLFTTLSLGEIEELYGS